MARKASTRGKSEYAYQQSLLGMVSKVREGLKELYRMERNHYNRTPTDKTKKRYEGLRQEMADTLQELSDAVNKRKLPMS